MESRPENKIDGCFEKVANFVHSLVNRTETH